MKFKARMMVDWNYFEISQSNKILRILVPIWYNMYRAARIKMKQNKFGLLFWYKTAHETYRYITITKNIPFSFRHEIYYSLLDKKKWAVDFLLLNILKWLPTKKTQTFFVQEFKWKLMMRFWFVSQCIDYV